jgi:hypothetical protein
MTIAEFQASLTADQPPDELTAVLTGLWWSAKGDWERAHQLVQRVKDVDGSWVHAYLHRKEDDQTNAAH